MAIILKVWRQIENPSPSIDTYLLQEHFVPIRFETTELWTFWRKQQEQQDK